MGKHLYTKILSSMLDSTSSTIPIHIKHPTDAHRLVHVHICICTACVASTPFLRLIVFEKIHLLSFFPHAYLSPFWVGLLADPNSFVHHLVQLWWDGRHFFLLCSWLLDAILPHGILLRPELHFIFFPVFCDYIS